MRTNPPELSSRDYVLAEQTFPRVPKSAPAARRWARDLYRSRGAQTDSVELLVSEVVTNAVLYAGRGEITIRILGSLWVEVCDESEALPQRRTASADDTGGRGLELVAAFADGFEVRPGPNGGKRVCFLPGRGECL